MKYLLFVIVFFPSLTRAQGFSTIEGGLIAIKGNYQPGAILTFTGGGFVDSKGDKAFQLGGGITIDLVNPDNIYAAPFFMMGLFNPQKKITPYANLHIGYGFYKGTGEFAGVHSNRGGLFTDVRAGAGFKVTRLLRVTPYVGMQGIMLRYVALGETQNSSFAGLAHGGVALVFTR